MTLRSVTLFVLVNCATSLSWASDRPDGVPEEAKWVKVDRVVDGDTIVLVDSTRVRLHGIDAPERDQPYGPMATAALEYRVERGVYCVETDTDRYGRMVATLYHSEDGYDINASLVCAGYAWWYERYAPDDKLLENCQKEARGAPKGLWLDDDVMAPWEWRKK